MAMSMTVKRVHGDRFTPDDILLASIDNDGSPIETAYHTIEVVSGENCTHGGGGAAGDYLHYKAFMRDDGTSDVEEDGSIDYSDCRIKVEQLSKGESVVKVKAKLRTLQACNDYTAAYEEWEDDAVAAYTAQIDALEAGGTVTAEVITQLRADLTANKAVYHEDLEGEDAEGFPEKPAEIEWIELETGTVTLYWGDDTAV